MPGPVFRQGVFPSHTYLAGRGGGAEPGREERASDVYIFLRHRCVLCRSKVRYGNTSPWSLSLIFPCAGAHFRDSFFAWRPIAFPGLRLSAVSILASWYSVLCIIDSDLEVPWFCRGCACPLKVRVPDVEEGPDPVLGLAVTQPGWEASIPDPI